MIQLSFAFYWQPKRWKLDAGLLEIWAKTWMTWLQLGPLELTLEIDW